MDFKKGDLIINECSVRDGDRYGINCFLCTSEKNQFENYNFFVISLTKKSIFFHSYYHHSYVDKNVGIKKVLFDSRKLRNKK